MAERKKCAVYKDGCEEHGFVHGAEAEELRAGIERLVAKYKRSIPLLRLVDLLDSVDARDSLAYRERRTPTRRRSRMNGLDLGT
jgi:hypothetical protein